MAFDPRAYVVRFAIGRTCATCWRTPGVSRGVAPDSGPCPRPLNADPIDTIDIEVRVRYDECDPMNVAHHSIYAVWLELARTEMLRRRDCAYADLEARGIYFVVARLSLRYRKPAKYDDILCIHAETLPTAGIKVEHRYTIRRGDTTLAEGETTLVCVDGDGRPRPIPEGLLGGAGCAGRG